MSRGSASEALFDLLDPGLERGHVRLQIRQVALEDLAPAALNQEFDDLRALGRGHGPCLSQVPALFKGSGCRAGQRGSSREEHREDLSARRRHDSLASRPENPARLAMPDRYGDDFPESIRHGIRVVKLDLIPPRH